MVAVIGDGSLSGGLAFEGLDNAVELGSGLIVVVNDNEWSIAPNHGGIYRSLADLRATRGASDHNVFRALGLDYRYLEDGHDVAALETALSELRGTDHPVVLHVHTEKGHGYAPAAANPEGWHHAVPFDVATGNVRPGAAAHPADENYANVTGALLTDWMQMDPRVVAVNAATPYIMGFTPELRAHAGRRFVDVGIAEEHAVSYVTGLARAGGAARPRHLRDLPAAGLRPALARPLPERRPGDHPRLRRVRLWHHRRHPPGILRHPDARLHAGAHLPRPHLHRGVPRHALLVDRARGRPGGHPRSRRGGRDVPPGLRAARTDYAHGWEVLRKGSQVALLALGDFLPLGEKVADALAAGGVSATLVNPRLATTPDEALLGRLAADHRVIVTLEDGILDGGFGERCARALAAGDVRTLCYGLPRAFVDRYDPAELLARCGITVEGVVEDALAALGRA